MDNIKYRHKFFRMQDKKFVNEVTAVLKNSELTDRERYEKLVEELQLMRWNPQIEKLEGTDLYKFELDTDKFTCFLIGDETDLWRDVLQYFNEMMLVNI